MEGSNSSSKLPTIILIIVFIFGIIGVGILIFNFIFSKNQIDSLTRSLTQTQQEIQEVKEDAMEEKDTANGADAQSLVRLALAKAYAQSLRTAITQAAARENIDRVTVYLEGNPSVLVTANPNLPQDIAEAAVDIKTRSQTLRNIPAVGTILTAVDQATYTQGETITLTGTIELVQDDEIYGGSIFSITDENGNVYYLHFNDTNSTTIKNTLVGDEVDVEIEVTSSANEPLTFEVTSGPTLATQPTQATQVSPVPTTITQ